MYTCMSCDDTPTPICWFDVDTCFFSAGQEECGYADDDDDKDDDEDQAIRRRRQGS